MALDRYAALHASPQGPGDARPTATQVLRDQGLLGNHWPDKTVLITGGSAGLGAESARVLHQTGARIFITGRDRAKATKVAQEISAANISYPPVQVIAMDQSSLASVRAAAAEFQRRGGGQLHVLMLNAGVMGCPPGATADGFELIFGVNHLGPFLLFQLLVPALVAATAPAFRARVVVVSSAGHRASDIDMDGLEGGFDPGQAYARSKTANILMANEIERRYAPRGVHALSLNPGLILLTEIGRNFPGTAEGRRELFVQSDALLGQWEKTVEQGAATQVWASVARELEGKGGLYLDDLQVAKEADEAMEPRYYLPGWKRWVWDGEKAARLWRVSLKMVGLPEEEG